MNREDIIEAASAKVDRILSQYPNCRSGERILAAAIGMDRLVAEVLELEPARGSTIVAIAFDFLKQLEIDSEDNHNRDDTLGISIQLGLVTRSVLVGLAAAAIGASSGVVGRNLHPILIGIVGAEAAVLINVLSALITDGTRRERDVDGLDLAVLSVLQKGHYTAEEIRTKISGNLAIGEVRMSLRKLKRLRRVKDGRWPRSYAIDR